VIRIFFSREKPAFLPCHVTNIMFFAEVARKYNYWLHLFQEKRKKQFIPLPGKVGDFVLKNVNKIDEFAVHSSNFNLRYAEILRGFDYDKIFRQHLKTLGFDDCFFKKHMSENRDTSDLDTLKSNTKLYREHGKGPDDKSVQSTNITPKSTTSRSIAPTTHHNNKATQISSNGGGDNDPPHSKIDSSHKLPVDKKRKKNVVQVEELEI
jgi:hypothetical protein